MILRFLLFFALLAGILFFSAGRWDLPTFWAYIGVFLAVMIVAAATGDEELMRERAKPGPGGQDCALRWNAMAVMLATWITAGLDVGRYHWSDRVPFPLQVAGLALTGVALCFAAWAARVNRFFSSAARIQRDRGHHLVTAGPYQRIRHPGYLSSITMFLVAGLALGSWWAIVPSLTSVPLFLRRIRIEERLLFAELEGYTEYAQRVPYRLVPGLW
jgi:protein-S-isoprenylcysteine O-methyltransferase Ste14